ncbi:MAG: Hsp20 family protein [Pseudomonadota bacterium]
MTRVSLLNSPMFLGFEEIERLVDRAGKSNEGYPPYNIEKLSSDGAADRLRITLAVAGFRRDQLDITVEDNQLTIRGRQEAEDEREYLHRGIAARQFQRTFILADGILVDSADLTNGLLAIDLVKPLTAKTVQQVKINANE